MTPSPNTLAGNPTGSFNIGLTVPADLSVKLVRQDNSEMENVISIALTMLVAVAGVFWGIVGTKGQNSSRTEVAAAVIFSLLSLASAGLLIRIKWKQKQNVISIPASLLANLPQGN